MWETRQKKCLLPLLSLKWMHSFMYNGILARVSNNCLHFLAVIKLMISLFSSLSVSVYNSVQTNSNSQKHETREHFCWEQTDTQASNHKAQWRPDGDGSHPELTQPFGTKKVLLEFQLTSSQDDSCESSPVAYMFIVPFGTCTLHSRDPKWLGIARTLDHLKRSNSKQTKLMLLVKD